MTIGFLMSAWQLGLCAGWGRPAKRSPPCLTDAHHDDKQDLRRQLSASRAPPLGRGTGDLGRHPVARAGMSRPSRGRSPRPNGGLGCRGWRAGGCWPSGLPQACRRSTPAPAAGASGQPVPASSAKSDRVNLRQVPPGTRRHGSSTCGPGGGRSSRAGGRCAMRRVPPAGSWARC